MTAPAYEDRYCAFVDIFGFGELIEKSTPALLRFKALRDLSAKVHNPLPTNAAASPRADFHAQSISGAVALSAATTPSGLGSVIHSINQYLAQPIGHILAGQSKNRASAEYTHPILTARMKGPGKRPAVDFVVFTEYPKIEIAV